MASTQFHELTVRLSYSYLFLLCETLCNILLRWCNRQLLHSQIANPKIRCCWVLLATILPSNTQLFYLHFAQFGTGKVLQSTVCSMNPRTSLCITPGYLFLRRFRRYERRSAFISSCERFSIPAGGSRYPEVVLKLTCSTDHMGPCKI